MHEFAEEYVANLKPRDERYDTRLGDDFYVATFPNGIKTWAYVFEVNGYTRRQTLGVYPEMPLEQALESLYSARRTRAVESELAEQGMDGAQVRSTEDSPINLTARSRGSRLKIPKLNKRFIAGIATGAGISLAVVMAAGIFLQASILDPAPTQVAVVDAPQQTIAATSAEKMLPAAPIPVTAADSTLTQVEQQPAPAIDIKHAQAIVAADVADQSAEPEALSESQLALRKLQTDMAGTLAWSQLTSDIKNGEPVDQLNWVVELDRASKRVFYFVRVRGLAGAKVRYLWRHQGKVMKEDSVQVGQGWHSPAYSGMTLTAERLGRWEVEVYGPDGQELGSEEFETRMTDNTPQLSQR